MKNKIAFVLGNNVSTSLSPIIFNYWFVKHSVSASYGYKEIKEEEFSKKIKKILTIKDVCGLNITIPFKEKIIPYLDDLDEPSQKIGAVNCVTIKNKKFYGSNTDWIGFSETLKEQIKKNKIIKKEAIIIGYGGTAKAILYALLKLKYKKIHIFNRSLDKMKNINNKAVETHRLTLIKNFINNSNLIINTTPINPLKDLKISKKLSPNTIISDVVYKPPETKFLKYFKNQKIKTNGLSMLVNQASPCFKKWFGTKPIIDHDLFKAIRKNINS